MKKQYLNLPPPPGLISALTAGFESVANSITVIALPVLFDLFFWFGPRLRLESLIRPWLDQMPALYSQVLSAEALEAARSLWEELLSGFNLFSVLRTFPVGISSLLSYETLGQSPLGAPLSFQAGSILGILAWIALLLIVGWLIGTLYYYWVTKVSLQPETLPLGRSVSQVLFLSFIWLAVLFGLGFPAVFFISVASLISPLVGQVAVFIAGMVVLWLLMPIYFSAHGIFTYKMNAYNAIMNSLRMTRFTLPTTFLFLFLLLIISRGLRFLWTTPSQDSWWMLVGILGHAFVSTALLAASFIYYRNVNNWLKSVLEQLNKQAHPIKL